MVGHRTVAAELVFRIVSQGVGDCLDITLGRFGAGSFVCTCTRVRTFVVDAVVAVSVAVVAVDVVVVSRFGRRMSSSDVLLEQLRKRRSKVAADVTLETDEADGTERRHRFVANDDVRVGVVDPIIKSLHRNFFDEIGAEAFASLLSPTTAALRRQKIIVVVVDFGIAEARRLMNSLDSGSKK